MDFDDFEAFLSEASMANAFDLPSQLRSSYGDRDSELDDITALNQNGLVNVARGSKMPSSKRRRISSPEPEGDNRKRRQLSQLASLLHPGMDMTTAIVSCAPTVPSSPESNRSLSDVLTQTENLDMVPTFYAYSVKSCLLPIRKVQDQLVAHYFVHVHPMFPLVDETYFTKLHGMYLGREELMDKTDFMVYYAIIVAGFAHLSEAQVLNTPYRSVTDGQEAHVDQLKARYWSRQTSDPVALTQICLVLSLWSPASPGLQNNSYWIDMAVKHAVSGRLWEPIPENVTASGRRKILWWCCLIRDRVLALGMRRPHRLHKIPAEDITITARDFGPETSVPSYSSVRSKQTSILAFIWFCKLSGIMEELAIMQRRHRFAKDWNGDRAENISSDLDEVKSLHQKLQTWLADFEKAMSNATVDEDDQRVSIPVSLLRILAGSLSSLLYQPYLHLEEGHPALVRSGVDPLKQIKEGARGVARNVTDVMINKRTDAIPPWLCSWVTLPAAVYHVNQRIRLDSQPDKVLMPFLAQLVRRTTGALMLLMTVRSATKDYIDKIANVEDDEVSAPSSGFTFINSGISEPEVPHRREAELLAFVSKVVDCALESNGGSDGIILKTS